jgi:Flp pilus assembly protein TadD
LRGQAAIRARDFELAVDNLRTALQLEPNHFESRFTLEHVFYRTDPLLEADRETELLLALPGREAAGELLRGQLRFQVSDPAGAVEHFQRALRHPEQWDSVGDPNFFRTQLARCLLRTGQPALARDSLRRLTEQTSRQPRTGNACRWTGLPDHRGLRARLG